MSLRCVLAAAILSPWQWNAEAQFAVLIEFRYVVEEIDNRAADGTAALQHVARFHLGYALPNARQEFRLPRIHVKHLPNDDVLPFSQMQRRNASPDSKYNAASERFPIRCSARHH